MRALMGAQIARVLLDDSNRRQEPRRISRKARRRLLPGVVALVAIAGVLLAVAQALASV